MDRRVDVRHFVHRRSCDISSSNMAAYERWPRVSARGTKYSSEVCRMGVPPLIILGSLVQVAALLASGGPIPAQN